MTTTAWSEAKTIIGETRVLLGPQASQQWWEAPEHLAMVLARYRAAAALIGNARSVLELGCGEGIGARILAQGRNYWGLDDDREAIMLAAEHAHMTMQFDHADVLAAPDWLHRQFQAVVALDVIEHVPAEREGDFMETATVGLSEVGACVIGTPNAAFDHLASPQSRAGHVNTYTHDRLHALMQRHFRLVQSFGMQDTALHTGHPEARHYLLLVGVGPR